MNLWSPLAIQAHGKFGLMHILKSKRKRPNLETAHEWLKGGSFIISPKEHFLSDQEREAEIKEISDELTFDLPRQFPRTQNLEYAILKSHLIIEHVITQYIRCHSRVTVEVDDIRFTFSQKLEIAYLMGFGEHDPVLLPCIGLLNKARNQVAHTFSLKRHLIDELIHITGEGSDPIPIENDRHRISGLRRICKWICAYTAGRMEAEYHVMKVTKDKRNRP